MPLKKKYDLPPIKTWSFSKYNVYSQCPALCDYRSIQKLPEPKGKALVKGIHYHDQAENYLKGKLNNVPVELKRFEKQFKELRKLNKAGEDVGVEEMWVLDKNWDYLGTWEYGGKWLDGTWVFLKLDAWVLTDDGGLCIIDWKTGKQGKEEDYIEQLELYALAAFSAFEDLECVSMNLHYLELGPEASVVVTPVYPEDLPAIKKKWEKRVKRMLSDRTFVPNPSYLCNYCHFSKEKGGPCRY